MLSAREYVEMMTCNRLNKKLPSDKVIDHLEFEQAAERLKNLMYKMSRIKENKIHGFSPEDLEGFFMMKLHQEMRRGRTYNNEFSYFAKTFQNLIRNLNRDITTALKNLPDNPLDDCVFFSKEDPLD